MPVFNAHVPAGRYSADQRKKIADALARRSPDAMIISVQIADTRKRKLLAAIVRLLHENVGISPDDVFVSLIPIPPENFSFGRGFSPFDKGD